MQVRCVATLSKTIQGPLIALRMWSRLLALPLKSRLLTCPQRPLWSARLSNLLWAPRAVRFAHTLPPTPNSLPFLQHTVCCPRLEPLHSLFPVLFAHIIAASFSLVITSWLCMNSPPHSLPLNPLYLSHCLTHYIMLLYYLHVTLYITLLHYILNIKLPYTILLHTIILCITYYIIS